MYAGSLNQRSPYGAKNTFTSTLQFIAQVLNGGAKQFEIFILFRVFGTFTAASIACAYGFKGLCQLPHGIKQETDTDNVGPERQAPQSVRTQALSKVSFSDEAPIFFRFRIRKRKETFSFHRQPCPIQLVRYWKADTLYANETEELSQGEVKV